MTAPLRALIVDDVADDAELMAMELGRNGLPPVWRRVETASETAAALAESTWDVVLADFSLPHFDALRALALVRQADPDMPFIVVSGTVGEELAAATVRAGAGDYVLKQNLRRLPTAVEREIREAGNRRARRRAEAEVARLAEIVRSSTDAIISMDLAGTVVSWNPAAERLYGWTAAEAVGRAIAFAVPPDRRIELDAIIERIRRGERVEHFETVRISRDGARIEVALTISPVFDPAGRLVGASKIARDITVRKRAEEAVTNNEARFRALVEKSYDGVALLAADGTILYASPSAGRIGGRRPEEFVGTKIFDWKHPEDAPGHAAGLEQLVRSPGAGMTGESRFLHSDGSWRWVESTFTNLLADPAVGAVVVNFRDVTERARAEEERRRIAAELERTGRLLRAVADNASDAIFVKDRSGKYLLFNEAAARFVGRPVAEVLGKDDAALFDPDSARAVMERDRRVMESGEIQTEEEELTAAGTTRVYQATKAPYRDERGEVIGLLGISRDVTAEKRAERALRESEERLQLALAATGLGTFDWNPTDDVHRWDDRTRALFGVGAGAVPDMDLFYRRLHPDDRAGTEAKVRAALDPAGDGIYRAEYRMSSPDGTWRWVAAGGRVRFEDTTAGRRAVRFVGTVLDVTERKSAEAAMARDALLLANVRDSVTVTDLNDVVTYWNDGATRIFGWTAAEMLGRRMADRVPDEGRAAMAAAVRSILAGREFCGEWLDYRKDGTRVRIEARVRRIDDAGGVPIGIMGISRDITDRKQAEEALRLLERAVRAVTQGILITDPDRPGNPIIYASPGFQRLTGYSASELLGRNCRILQGRDTDPQAVAVMREAVRGARPCTVEVLNHRKDGSRFWNEVSISPVFDDGGRLTNFVGVQTDVTRRRTLEEQNRQSQKMEAIGRLAGGVAHDFNNLLSGIIGFADLALMKTECSDLHRKYLEEIRRAGDRAGHLTRQLLAFSRRQVIEPVVMDLNAAVAEMEHLLRRTIGEDIEMAVSLRAVGRVKADPGQIEQIIMNMAVNARDAMPNGGRLTIETADFDGELIGVAADAADAARPGPWVMLTVSDNGVGMGSEVMSHLFEPFFTTKEVGRGTGLGLATVYGIIRQNGGHVSVYSELGRGTTFKVYLPRVEEGEETSRGRLARAGSLPRGGETVLLAEDDPMVRAVAADVLTTCGYSVLQAAGAEEALAVAGRPGTIDLLLTDMVMPGLGGRQLAERLAAHRPGMKILYMSGYTDDAIVRHGALPAGTAFLQKPFTPASLAGKVREVLDGRV